MNLLLDATPESVVIDGIEYDVNTDYRVFIQIEQILHNSEMQSRTKVEAWLRLVYGMIPPNVTAAVEKIMYLYNCGSIPEKKESNSIAKPKEKLLYDFEFDAPYIYAAFMAQYGIDLSEEYASQFTVGS